MTDPRDVVIRRTEDWPEALRVGMAAGLEGSGHETDGLVALWGAYAGERMIGAASLRYWQGLHIIGWMAVAGEQRGRGIGQQLLAEVEREAGLAGARELWAAARIPGFYAAAGYADGGGEHERAVLLASCLTCPQHGRECRPHLMVKRLLPE